MTEESRKYYQTADQNTPDGRDYFTGGVHEEWFVPSHAFSSPQDAVLDAFRFWRRMEGDEVPYSGDILIIEMEATGEPPREGGAVRFINCRAVMQLGFGIYRDEDSVVSGLVSL